MSLSYPDLDQGREYLPVAVLDWLLELGWAAERVDLTVTSDMQPVPDQASWPPRWRPATRSVITAHCQGQHRSQAFTHDEDREHWRREDRHE